MGSFNPRYSFILLIALLFFIPPTRWFIPILHVCSGIIVFYVLPGIVLAHRVFHACSRISGCILAIILGMCFHIVYLYVLSFFSIPFSLAVLLIPSVIFAVLADYYQVTLPPTDTSEYYLCAGAVIFFLLTVTISPGEDANGHLLFVHETLEKGMLPHTYSLYDTLSVSYHMGFHAMVSELGYISALPSRLLLPVLGALWGVFTMMTSYLCLRAMYGKKAGIVGGFLVCFAAIPPLYYLSFGAYASMLLFALQPLAIFLIYASRKWWDFPLISLVLAAGFMSHTAFILLWIPLAVLVHRYKLLIPACLMSLVLSIPHLMRLQPGYSPQEIVQLMQLWAVPETFRIEMLAERIGIFMVICGTGGILFLQKRNRTFFIVWICSLAGLALLSTLHISFPFHFIFLANRLIDFMFLPLALLSAIFLCEIFKGKYIIFSLLLMFSLVPHMYAAPRYSQDIIFNAESEDFTADYKGIQWIVDNTPPDAIILNEWWTGTGSAWITSLGDRQLIFPYLYVHDHFLDTLSVAQRGRDVLWVSLAPDSEQAHILLRAWGVDYIFLSSYVEDRVRWRRDSWNITHMISSPHYTLVFNEEDTYVFKVHLSPWNASQILPVHVPDIQTPVPGSLQPLILFTYHDLHLQPVTVASERGVVAEFLLLGSGNQITVPLPYDPSLRVKSYSPCEPESRTLVFNLPGYALGSMSLSWDWSIGPPYLLERDGHLYTYGVHALRIVYYDLWPGNVDVNILIDKKWESLAVIERTGDGSVKELLLLLPDSPVPLDIGFFVHGAPFSVISFAVEE
ncbi:MAG: hypothetical protein HXS47_01925 [Theionarchaea archaeon]|nr:hypothetical protein [Theionarchaea archaeon]